MRTSLLALALLLGAPAASQTIAAVDAQPATADALLARTVLLGASVTDGTGLERDLEVLAPLGVVLDAALAIPHGPVVTFGDMWFFRDPLRRGPGLAEKAREAEPTLLVALDFLFWYAYGGRDWRSDDERLARLEQGFELLDAFACPIVVGDVPDISLAVDGEGPLGQPIVSASMIPKPEARAKVNQRIREWARERGDVVVVPMASLLERLQRGEAVTVRDQVFPADPGLMLREDLLHPTLLGATALVLATLDALVEARPELGLDAVRWDPAEVRIRALELTAEEREKVRERERKREERRRRIEERKKREGEEEKGGGGDFIREAPVPIGDARSFI